MHPLIAQQDVAHWMESYGLFFATIALVLATAALTWATAVMGIWMRREFGLKTTPQVVPFGSAMRTSSGGDTSITQKFVNTGDCVATLEHIDMHVALKGLGGTPVVISTGLLLPVLLGPGQSVDSAFTFTPAVISHLGAVGTSDIARIANAQVHIRCSGPTKAVVETMWQVSLG